MAPHTPKCRDGAVLAEAGAGAPANSLKNKFFENLETSGVGPQMLLDIEMISAGSEAFRKAIEGGCGDCPEIFVADIFYAMLSASPLGKGIFNSDLIKDSNFKTSGDSVSR